MERIKQRVRSLIFALGVLPALIATPVVGQEPDAVQWMDSWMFGTRYPEGEMHVGRFKDPVYYLLKPIAWKPNDKASKLPPVLVPAGFITDFASIPRIFWSALRPDGEYAYAAIIHDYLYWEQRVSRETADNIFREVLKDFNVDTITTLAIYNAVRVGGGSAWRDIAKAKAKGERRILRALPTDPRISWAEWRKRPDVLR